MPCCPSGMFEQATRIAISILASSAASAAPVVVSLSRIPRTKSSVAKLVRSLAAAASAPCDSWHCPSCTDFRAMAARLCQYPISSNHSLGWGSIKRKGPLTVQWANFGHCFCVAGIQRIELWASSDRQFVNQPCGRRSLFTIKSGRILHAKRLTIDTLPRPQEMLIDV